MIYKNKTIRSFIYLFLIFFGFLFSIWIDPYINLHNSFTVLTVNAILPLLLMITIWGVTGRIWIGFIVEIIILCTITYVSYLKNLYLGIDILYNDSKLINNLLSNPELLAGYIPKKVFFLCFLLTILSGIIIFIFRNILVTSKKNRKILIINLFILIIISSFVKIPRVIPLLNWDYYNHPNGAKKVGIFGNILLTALTSEKIKITVNEHKIQRFWKDSNVIEAVNAINDKKHLKKNAVHPDVVVIQSESLFDPRNFVGMQDQIILKNITNYPNDAAYPWADLKVPVFGGRTLQTEFEVLTGVPLSLVPSSIYAYYELAHKKLVALPSYFREQGYNTLAIHPNSRYFWNRNRAFPNLGFNYFLDINSFLNIDYTNRGFVSDQALMQAVISQLDTATGPTFIMAITINNHGPWGKDTEFLDSNVKLPAFLSVDARQELSDYIKQIRDADESYGYLINALRRRKRPTLVVFYGDHLPLLPKIYNELNFINNQPPSLQNPPVRFWANFPIPPVPEQIPSYLLSGYIIHAAGMQLKEHFLANKIVLDIFNDSKIRDEQMEELIDQYGNIALKGIFDTNKNNYNRTVTVSKNKLKSLIRNLMENEGTCNLNVEDDKFNFNIKNNKSIKFTFNVSGLDRITIRIYLNQNDNICLSPQKNNIYKMKIEADDKTINNLTITSFMTTENLYTVDTSKIDKLTFTIEKENDTGQCDTLVIKPTQIECTTVTCEQTKNIAQVHEPLVSRSLSINFQDQDRQCPPLGSGLSLNTNLYYMLRKMTKKQEGSIPFSIRNKNEFFMHPASETDTWVEFDVTNLKSIEMNPFVQKLYGQCLALNEPGREAGVVGLSILLDDNYVIKHQVITDDYKKTLKLDLENHQRLKLVVDIGNKVDWCDWFSVKFSQIEPLAAR